MLRTVGMLRKDVNRQAGPFRESPFASLRQLDLFPTGPIAIYRETAAALGLRER